MGRKTSLTEEIAQKLEFYWQLGADTLSDEQICWRIGISYGQLKGWLKRDAIPVKPDGTLGPEGLRGIRARAKVSTQTTYLARLNEIARDAHAAGDFNTASKVNMWLLEKQFPKGYGKQVDNAQSTGRAGVLRVGPQLTDAQWQAKHGPKQQSIAQT